MNVAIWRTFRPNLFLSSWSQWNEIDYRGFDDTCLSTSVFYNRTLIPPTFWIRFYIGEPNKVSFAALLWKERSMGERGPVLAQVVAWVISPTSSVISSALLCFASTRSMALNPVGNMSQYRTDNSLPKATSYPCSSTRSWNAPIADTAYAQFDREINDCLL